MDNKEVNIVCIGIGGCGCRNVDLLNKIYNHDIDKYILLDTDLKSLQDNIHEAKKYMPFVRNIQGIIIGNNLFKGLGVDNPEQGYQAATQSRKEIMDLLQDVDGAFVVAGLGGGTGTGGTIAVASFLKELGVKFIGVVTMPFKFEGEKRRRIANDNLEKLKQYADNVVIFENEDILMFELSAKASEVIKLRYTTYGKIFREADL